MSQRRHHHPFMDQIFAMSPIVPPERIASGWPDGLLDSDSDIAEHLRQALPHFITDSELAKGQAIGRAYVFCRRDPHTHQPGDCIYTTRIRADAPTMNAIEGMACSGLMGMVIRGLATWGHAQAVALISTAQLMRPGEPMPKSARDLGRVNAWMISVSRKAHEMAVFVSTDKYGGPAEPLPVFHPYDQQVVDLFGLIHALAPLPDLAALARAQDTTRMSMSDLVHAHDHRERLRVALVMESQTSLSLADLPTRHRLRVMTIDVESHQCITDMDGPWHLDPHHVRLEAERARPPLAELGLLMRPDEAAAQPPPEQRH